MLYTTTRPNLLRLCVLGLILLALLTACDSGPPTPDNTSEETDREALIALYNAADGESWPRKLRWTTDASLSAWQGVTTDDSGRVIELSLPRQPVER